MNAAVPMPFRSILAATLLLATTAAQEQPGQKPKTTSERWSREMDYLAGRSDRDQGAEPEVRRIQISTSTTERRRFPFRGDFAFGFASLDFDAGRLGREQDNGSGVFRLDLQAMPHRRLGFGLTLETLSSDGLFTGQTIDNNAGPAPAEADFSMGDVDAHFTVAALASHRFEWPFQIGPWLQHNHLHYDDANSRYDFANHGLRIGTRPQWTIPLGERADLTLFAGASFGIAHTILFEDLVGREETYRSHATQFRAEGGFRFAVRHFTFGFTYVYSDTHVDDSRPEDGRRVPDLDFDASMFLLSFGGRF